jgi:hypothetical protein
MHLSLDGAEKTSRCATGRGGITKGILVSFFPGDYDTPIWQKGSRLIFILVGGNKVFFGNSVWQETPHKLRIAGAHRGRREGVRKGLLSRVGVGSDGNFLNTIRQIFSERIPLS